jgi:hypothetical protein
MYRYRWLGAVAVAVAAAGLAVAGGETVGVSGSDVRFPTHEQVTVDYRPVRLALTGTAVRKAHGLPVYAVGSYVQEGVPAKTAERIVAADVVKQMHLVLERPLDGPTMFEGMRTGIRLNHSVDAFPAELGQFERCLRGRDLAKGQHVLLTWLPRVGLRCEAVGTAEVTIRTPAFARAVWEIYLGPNNLGESIKTGLTSRR